MAHTAPSALNQEHQYRLPNDPTNRYMMSKPKILDLTNQQLVSLLLQLNFHSSNYLNYLHYYLNLNYASSKEKRLQQQDLG